MLISFVLNVFSSTSDDERDQFYHGAAWSTTADWAGKSRPISKELI